MNIKANNLYVLYNEGNNKQNIFFDDNNYYLFLRLFRKYVSPFCDVICWSLIPNQYYFLVFIKEDGATKIKCGNIELSKFANGIRLMQSIYTKQINIQLCRTGSLFRPKAKAKLSDGINENCGAVAFNYIHNIPVTSGIVTKKENWAYSSFSDYFKGRAYDLCNYLIAKKLIGIDPLNAPKYVMKILRESFISSYSKNQFNRSKMKFVNINHILLHRSNQINIKESG